MKNLQILLIIGIVTIISSCCCKTYPPKQPCPEPNSITTEVEIYIGRVTFGDTIVSGTDSSYNNLIQLYGTFQTIWSNEKSLRRNDVVQIKTENHFQSFELEILCSPKEDHCHFSGSGEHSKLHITEIGLTSNEYKRITYNGVTYKTVLSKAHNESTSKIVWINDEFEFSNGSTQISLYGIFLVDTNNAFQKINGHSLLIDYTLNEHSGH